MCATSKLGTLLRTVVNYLTALIGLQCYSTFWYAKIVGIDFVLRTYSILYTCAL